MDKAYSIVNNNNNNNSNNKITPWLMEPGGSMSHSQRFSNNPYPESNKVLVLIPITLRDILILCSHLHLGLLNVSGM